MGLLGILQSDLRALSLEARKKFPDIKEAAERGILKLKTLGEKGADEEPELVNKSADDVLRPFLLACETNNTKLIALSVGAFQKLISHSAISAAKLPRVMRVLSTQADLADDTTKLKVLQCILSLLSTKNDLHGEALSQPLCICFRLHKNKTPTVQNTAAATLRQIVTLLFDRSAAELKNQDASTSDSISKPEQGEEISTLSGQRFPQNLPPCITDTHFLFQDLCSLSRGDNPVWLPLQNVSKAFCLELIECILDNHSELFYRVYEYRLVLKDRICPLLIQSLQMNIGSFRYSVRLMRIMSVFVKNFIDLMEIECEVFLERIIRMLTTETPIWLKTIALETLRIFCADVKLMRAIYLNYDSHGVLKKKGETERSADERSGAEGRIFYGIVHAVAQYIQRVFSINDRLLLTVEPVRMKCIDMLNSKAPPSTTSLTYSLMLGLECFMSIIDAITDIASLSSGVSTAADSTSGTNKTEKAGETEEDEEEGEENEKVQESLKRDVPPNEEISKQMAAICWAGMLPSISKLLFRTDDIVILQSILRAYQLFIHCCGDNQLYVARNAYLNSLCKFAAPPHQRFYAYLDQTLLFLNKCEEEEEHNSSQEQEQRQYLKLSFLKTIDYCYGEQEEEDKSTERKRFGVAAILQSEAAASKTLLEKNFLAAKCLLNIVNFMGQHLDTAWLLLLSTLEALDFVIRNPRQFGSSLTTGGEEEFSNTGAATSGLAQGGNSTVSGQKLGDSSPSSSSLNLILPSSTSSLSKAASSAALNALSCEMDALFKGSEHLDDSSIVYVVNSLCKLSRNALESSNFSGPLDFGTNKMVEVILENLYRLDKLWDTVADHLVYVSNHQLSSVRSVGVDALTKVISSTLSRLPAAQYSSSSIQTSSAAEYEQVANGGGGGEPPATLFSSSSSVSLSPRSSLTASRRPPPDLQLRFVETLDTLSQSKYSDTRDKALRSLDVILQSSGQALSTAWPRVLSIVRTVAINNDQAHIQRAFQSVAFICSDFLANLPVDCLAQCITSIGCFGLQTAFMNTSLKAVGLLWDVADFLANQQKRLLTHNESASLSSTSSKEESESSNSTVTTSLYDSATLDRLWIATFRELKHLCVDSRPEVRNGAVRSLFKTLATHGTILEPATWATCISEIVFPLMTEVKQQLSQASDDRVDNSEMEKGKSLVILVHHSRNTVLKQWNETVALALDGLVQVFRTFFPKISQLTDFTNYWQRLMQDLGHFASNKSDEVAQCAVVALKDIMHKHVSDVRFQGVLWECYWTTMTRVGECLVAERQMKVGNNKEQTILLHFVDTITSVHRKFHDFCSSTDIKRILTIIGPMPHYPPDMHEELSQLQKRTLALIEGLPPVQEDIYPVIIEQLLDYISFSINYTPSKISSSGHSPSAPSSPIATGRSNNDIASSSSGSQRKSRVFSHSSPSLSPTSPSATQLHLKPSLFHPLAISCIRVLLQYYTQLAPSSVRAQLFEYAIKVIGHVMMTKYCIYASPLWKQGINAFIAIVKKGLPDIHSHSDANRIWTQLYACMQEFLFHDRSLLPLLSPEQLKDDEELDASLIRLLTNTILALSPTSSASTATSTDEVVVASQKIQERFIEILFEGSNFTPAKQQRELFGNTCYKELFAICSQNYSQVINTESGHLISELALPLLMKRVKEVLNNFMEEDRKSGFTPLARHQLLEVDLILSELLSLELPPPLQQQYQQSEKEETQSDNVASHRSGKRRHLVALYPIFCQCITSKEAKLKDLLKELLLKTGEELRIC
ncbi:Endocytosis and vacuole integrity protein [Balamuthia mandrillaris]